MNSVGSTTDEIKTLTGRFDVHAIARTLPETATTLLVDKYLTDRPAASARVFRVYRRRRRITTRPATNISTPCRGAERFG
jgi:hypothetical protein